MANESVFELLNGCESDGEMTHQMAVAVEEHLDSLMGIELKEVEDLVEKEPELAFTRFARLTGFLNAAIASRPSIINRLKKWVQGIKKAANAVAKKLGANGFSIGVVGPRPGVSVSLSFPIT